jgi:transposase InsO family protein
MHKELLEQINDEVMPKKINKQRVVVPKSMQTQVVQLIHNRGHLSIAQTEELVSKDYWFRKMRKTVENVVLRCRDCSLTEKKRMNQLNTREKKELPFDTYHVDLLGPLACTKKIYEYIFVVVDDFSKFVWLYSIRSRDAAEVIRRLKRQSVNFGNPRIIISYAATPFMSSDFKEYCNTEGIEHILSTIEISWTNDQMERLKQTLIPLLKILCPQKPHVWRNHVDTAQKYLNAIPTRSTNTAPFQLLFGTRLRMKDDMQIWQ